MNSSPRVELSFKEIPDGLHSLNERNTAFCFIDAAPAVQTAALSESADGSPVRADIIVYSSPKACSDRGQGKIDLIIECKPPTAKEGLLLFTTSANGAATIRLKNEYGSLQQHIEAKHIAGILLPIPPNWDEVKDIIPPTRSRSS